MEAGLLHIVPGGSNRAVILESHVGTPPTPPEASIFLDGEKEVRFREMMANFNSSGKNAIWSDDLCVSYVSYT